MWVCKCISWPLGFPGGTSGKVPACQCRRWYETWVQSLSWEDPLEKDMATHSSILVWGIPWTEEPGELQSTRLPRVRYWSDLACMPGSKFRRWSYSFFFFFNRTQIFIVFNAKFLLKIFQWLSIAFFLKFFKIHFYWNIADLQYCVSFCYTATLISYTYIYSFSDYFALWVIREYWIEFLMLYS